ncbi:S8 family serine peptidase [Paenibacillus macerans]|uniref:S8 family serine peptidase n=1 Tax=Paenibacillus macerans TaxID=44252 RepID=UPI002DB8EB5B|nr:S8 family serine peptidase [Paenibacillus macerans]MEC0135365.1 S8 family serine peptidase [Paenibacillus macerans]
MIRFKRFRKNFSLGMSILLVLTFVPATYAENAGAAASTSLKSSSPQIAEAKIDDKLTTQFKQDDYVTYLVKLKEQTDTASVSKLALQKAATEKATPSAAKLSARTSVISALRETASRTQFSLENYLRQEQKSGEVKDYKSYFIVNAMAVTSTKEVLDQIALFPEVEKILPNEERFLDKVEIDKQEAAAGQGTSVKDAAADNAGAAAVKPSSVEWNIAQVNAPEVWAQGIDGTGIVVANLDTGVEYTHPALRAKWRGFDAAGNIVNPELSWYDPHSHASLPADTHGHGTHTMGTMVGSEPDGSNQIGVAPGAKWIAVRIFNPSTTDAIILDGGQWLLAPVDAEGNLHPELAPDVVNNSWGGGSGLDEWYRPVVQAWRDAQIFPEFSAGNVDEDNPGGPGSVANPANYPEAFATGATDINRNLADFSLLGPSPYGEIKPEVSAPGVNIRSSVPGGGYEGGWNGTSMAGPHTTAIAALLLQANHSLTVDQLEEVLTSTATPRTDSQFPNTPNNGYGHGIVNALDAVGSVLEGVGTVSGRVVTAGDDFVEPVLEHTPPSLIYEGFDVTLTAHAADNVAVTSVEFYAREAGTEHYLYLPAKRVSGTSQDGVYEATVPSFLVGTAGLEYYIRVSDYGGNGFDTAPYSVTVSAGIQPGYEQDFETGVIGYASGGTGNTWAWGAPVSGPGSAYSGEKVYATNLSGTYSANANSYLLAPPIDLTGSPEGALLSFKHWYDLENNRDYGTVYIASEESDYAFAPAAEFTGTSGGWKTQYIDLRPYAGQQVYLQFNLTSDGSVQKAGWYLDDLSLQAPDDVAPAAPGGLSGSVNFVGSAELSWSAPADEDVKEYTVYRSVTSGTGYEAIATTAETAYTDASTATGATYYYAVAAIDYSGNESEKSNEIALTIERPVSLFSDDFDGADDGGWTHSGTQDEWERGTPSAPGPSSAVSPPNVWGTDLDDTYANGADYSLVSPAIDLSGVDNATLAFDHWFEIESNYDFGYVEASSDGGATWAQLGRFSHSTNGKQWSPVYYSLDEYAGGAAKIRFRLKTDNSVAKAGWYIDNVQVLSVNTPATKAAQDVVDEITPQKSKADKPGPAYKLIRTTKSEYNAAVGKAQGSGEVGVSSLPASATVTVVETGRSVKTDPATGKYSLTHVAGNYTLKAEAYGYYPQTLPVSIEDQKNAKANFNLQAIPKGQIAGTISDERSGEPIADATVIVLEDAAIAPLRTGEDGGFSLEVLEGTYTLSVSARDYYSGTITITVPPDGSADGSLALKPFIGFPGEIGYDDGTAENAWSFNSAGNAWAVRMTPESGAAQVTGASIRFWNEEWPVPGGTAFQYAVFDASGPDGSPGRQLAGPFDGTALRNDRWTTLELPEPVTVEGDFYIVYIQTLAGTSAPGLAADENGPHAGRSWQRVSGVWSQTKEEDGNFMIRAIVRYPVNAPVITSPAAGSFTNQPTIAVTGTSPANEATIKLYNGTEPAGTATVENGRFSLNTKLHPGANELSAEVVVNGKTTDRSLPRTVTLDSDAPQLDVVSPRDGFRTNSEVLNVAGTALDDYLSKLTVNGAEVAAGDAGSFAHRILINAGENIVTVTATDRAGNETTVTRAVYVDLELPEITGLSPAEDVHLTAGEPLTVAFDSVPGLDASFRIELPVALAGSGGNGIALEETFPGHYEGVYVTPASLVLDGGVIVVSVRDEAGNAGDFQAPGRLFVAAPGGNPPGEDPGEDPGENPGEDPDYPGQNPPDDNLAPKAVIKAANSAQKRKQVEFDGRRSSDEDGRIVSYSWQFGDGGSASGAKVKHRFDRAGTYTVTLTVTDNDGATGTAVHTIKIK